MSVFAQKFGHLKSADVLTVMPEFTKAQTDIQAMQKQYEDEMKRATDELTKNILNTNRNKPTFLRTFRKDARKNCRNYRKRNAVPTRCTTAIAEIIRWYDGTYLQKIEDAIKAVGQEGGYTYIFDLNRTEIPYVNEAQSTDVTAAVKAKVGIK